MHHAYAQVATTNNPIALEETFVSFATYSNIIFNFLNNIRYSNNIKHFDLTMVKRDKSGTIHFDDYPLFQPNLTPLEIFQLGSFGGTYWRPIYSTVVGKKLKNRHLKYGIKLPDDLILRAWDNYDKKINKYGVKVGTTLEFWESQNWITKYHPYGWVEWYCDFYAGNRCPDDERQITRWINTAGPNSRFRKRLINLVKKNKSTYDDFTISPKIRQTLQHWGYQLCASDIT